MAAEFDGTEHEDDDTDRDDTPRRTLADVDRDAADTSELDALAEETRRRGESDFRDDDDADDRQDDDRTDDDDDRTERDRRPPRRPRSEDDEDGTSPEDEDDDEADDEDDDDDRTTRDGDEPSDYDPADPDTWPDEIRKTSEQYENDFERTKALHTTKLHSNEQHTKIKELSSDNERLKRELEDVRAGRAGDHPRRTAEDREAPPPPIEVRQRQEQQGRLADAFDELQLELKTLGGEYVDPQTGKLVTARGAIQELQARKLKLDGVIEEAEAELKTLKEGDDDDYRDRLERKLSNNRSERSKVEFDLETKEAKRERIASQASGVHQAFKNLGREITWYVQSQKQAAETKEREAKAHTQSVRRETERLESAIHRAAKEAQIPKEERAAFRRRALMEHLHSSEKEFSSDNVAGFMARQARQFNRERGRRPETVDSERDRIRDRREAVRQRAPRGDRAVAPIDKRARPLGMKDADRLIARSLKTDFPRR